ncbi:MAG TPA: response regulator transcription factor [Solirubrobacterales bacterium]|nr:response regulator transcription factor [Solirubrobacterales bacterium]
MGTFAKFTSGRPKALAIGDDAEIRRDLRGLLAAADFQLVEAGDGGNGLRVLFDERPDVVVLDLELADTDGFAVITKIREVSDVPLLAIAGDGASERVRALRTGADDCVPKPIGHELVARVEALLRRPRPTVEVAAIIEDEFIQIDRMRHRVEALGIEVPLTPTEFRMLGAFAENPGRVLGHGQLLDMVWGDRIRAKDEVKLYVSYLRRKLGAAGVDPVETVRGVGYRYQPRHAEEA